MPSLPQGKNLKIALLILLILFSILLADRISKFSFVYGNIPAKDELYLLEWGASDGEIGAFTVFSTRERSCSVCGNPISLNRGENMVLHPVCGERIPLDCDSRSLAFSLGEGRGGDIKIPSVSTRFEEGELLVSIMGKGEAKESEYRRFQFLIDGAIVHEPAVRLNGSFSLTERLQAAPGNHALKVLLSGTEIYSGTFDVPRKGIPIELLLILASSAGISFLISKGKDNELMAISFAVLVVFGFVYQFALSGNLGLPSPIIPAVYIGGLIWALKERR